MRVSRRSAAALVAALVAFDSGRAAHAQDVVVFAAASLTNALDEAARLFERRGGAHAKIFHAASSALAKQIESGAPADMFISADLDWMNYLEQRHLIQPATRRNLLGNRLVLVAPADSDVHVEIKPGFDLAALSADSKNPSAVRLLDFLGSPAAKPIFEKEGFTVLVPGVGA